MAVDPRPAGATHDRGVCKIKLQPLTAAYFVKGRLGPMVQVMMLDSGCTQSLMPMGVYQRIHSAFRSGVRPVKGHGILADGSKIAFEGVADVTFKIGECEYQHEFVLADISHHVLLGLLL